MLDRIYGYLQPRRQRHSKSKSNLHSSTSKMAIFHINVFGPELNGFVITTMASTVVCYFKSNNKVLNPLIDTATFLPGAALKGYDETQSDARSCLLTTSRSQTTNS